MLCLTLSWSLGDPLEAKRKPEQLFRVEGLLPAGPRRQRIGRTRNRTGQCPEEEACMRISRRFTAEGQSPYAGIEFAQRTSEIRNPDGTTVFRQEGIAAPAEWSSVAVDIMAQKYFRKSGVPQIGPDHRMAGCWTHWGERYGYFDSPADARAFYDELCHMLAAQIAAPNSPQWFNTGLFWAYGLTGPAQGHHYVDPESGVLTRAASAYERPQPHACQPYHALVSTPLGPISIGDIATSNMVGLTVYDGREDGRGTTR